MLGSSEGLNAIHAPKPATASGVIAASLPPQIAAVVYPWRIARNASPIQVVPGKGSSRFRDTGACGDYRQFYVSDYEFVCNANLSRNFCEYHQSVAGHGDSEFSDGVFLADMLLRSIGTMFVPQVVCRYSTETDLREDRQCRNGVMRRLEKQVRQREEIERSMCRSVFFSMEWRNRKRKEEILRKAKKRLKRCLRSFYAS